MCTYLRTANSLAHRIDDNARIHQILLDFGCWCSLPVISSADRGQDAPEIHVVLELIWIALRPLA
jgi:hypothetical protein